MLGAEDDLPPFSDLTNDEDRERKAETQEPGTFHVVVNPESFSDLPEYRDFGGSATTEGSRRAGTAAEGGPTVARDPDEDGRSDEGQAGGVYEDPNVVILRHFEDGGRRSSTTPGRTGSSTSPATPSPTTISISTSTANLGRLTMTQEPGSRRSSIAIDPVQGVDARLIENYRRHISPVIMWNREVYPDGDLFEQEAARFPPVGVSFKIAPPEIFET